MTTKDNIVLQRQATAWSQRLFRAMTQAGNQDMVIDTNSVKELISLLDAVSVYRVSTTRETDTKGLVRI